MTTQPQISIIIPTLNEEGGIGDLLHYLNEVSNADLIKSIIVVDGKSDDRTASIARQHDAVVLTSQPGRAAQMNVGADSADSAILYFLHADTYPPKDFDKMIVRAWENGHMAGCFRMKFDTKNFVLRFFAYLTRINHIICRGGDQSLFISKEHFVKLGGFNADYRIYEDIEFIGRIYKSMAFAILPTHVITSARKYRDKGWARLQFHFAVIHLKNFMGAKPSALYSYYQRHILT